MRQSGQAGNERAQFPVAAPGAGQAKSAVASPIAQVQMRCSGCNRRLGDYVNEVKVGLVILEMKCPKCGHPHTEVFRGLIT